jgi:hypothetical protein
VKLEFATRKLEALLLSLALLNWIGHFPLGRTQKFLPLSPFPLSPSLRSGERGKGILRRRPSAAAAKSLNFPRPSPAAEGEWKKGRGKGVG